MSSLSNYKSSSLQNTLSSLFLQHNFFRSPPKQYKNRSCKKASPQHNLQNNGPTNHSDEKNILRVFNTRQLSYTSEDSPFIQVSALQRFPSSWFSRASSFSQLINEHQVGSVETSRLYANRPNREHHSGLECYYHGDWCRLESEIFWNSDDQMMMRIR